METLWQDVKYGARMLVKSPVFTLVAILTLALGIGANTAIFTVVEAVLLRGLAYHDPDRLVVVWEHNFQRGRRTNVVGPANYMRWKERSQSFEKLTALAEFNVTVSGLGEPEQVSAGLVAADFFETLGANAQLGRALGPQQGQPGGDDVVVLSHGYWQRAFGGDRGVLGRTLQVNNAPVTVLGVMPENFHGLVNTDLWVPVVFGEQHRNARGRYLVVVGRLKPGATPEQAQTEMAGIAEQIGKELPDFTGGWGVNIVPLREQLTGDLRLALLVLAGAVGFVLLIACGNVANLALARAGGRARELAVRAALGASRRQLVRQLLTESLLLALLGGAAGWILAVWAVAGLETMLPADLHRFTHIELNATVMGFTLAISLLTAAVFGVAPALAATHGQLQESLREGTSGSGWGAGRRRLRSMLVVSEVALSLVLLAGAGLLLKSFAKLNAVNPGFDGDNVLSLALSLPGRTYSEPAQIVQFYDRVMAGIETAPGVTSAGAISWQFFGRGSATSFAVVGRPAAPAGQEPVADVRMVTPRLFETLRIPLLRGRVFTGQESASSPRQVVINQTLAREHWPDQDPIGQRIAMSWGEDIEAEVIGVVGDVRLTALDSQPRATLYWPQSQMANSFMTVMVRSERDPAQLTGAIKAHIASVDPEIPVARVQKLEAVKAASLNQRRFTVLLLSWFATVAVTLAAVGIYGVMAYAVSQRTREIGIRMALGARPGDVLRMVLRGGAMLAGLGLAVGLAAALGLSRYLETLLFEVSTHDAGTFALVAALLLVVALAACWIPARRATKVDPMVALRYE